jgi:hypothetical protein
VAATAAIAPLRSLRRVLRVMDMTGYLSSQALTEGQATTGDIRAAAQCVDARGLSYVEPARLRGGGVGQVEWLVVA